MHGVVAEAASYMAWPVSSRARALFAACRECTYAKQPVFPIETQTRWMAGFVIALVATLRGWKPPTLVGREPLNPTIPSSAIMTPAAGSASGAGEGFLCRHVHVSLAFDLACTVDRSLGYTMMPPYYCCQLSCPLCGAQRFVI